MPYRKKEKNFKEDWWFTCRQCGECCRGYGGTYVTAEDIRNIAAYIGADPARFEFQFCQTSGSRPVLAQQKNGFCIFWDQLCTIHPVKPRMCREWPFIAGVLADPSNWKIMAASCPGIHQNAPIHLVQGYIRRLRAIHDRHP